MAAHAAATCPARGLPGGRLCRKNRPSVGVDQMATGWLDQAIDLGPAWCVARWGHAAVWTFSPATELKGDHLELPLSVAACTV